MVWNRVVSLAFQHRVNLQAQVKARIPGGIGAVPNVTFKPKDQQPTGTGIPIDPKGTFAEPVNEYVGFTYNAACVEVEVDILTGETKILRADIVYDMGKSLNPALDVGQIEGGFVMGLGLVLSEELVFEPDGPLKGALNTLNTWSYKPPSAGTIPIEFNIDLFPRESVPRIEENPNLLLSSKEVGEPPLILAATVYFAIKHAVLAARRDRDHDEWFRMDTPATPQRVREACLVETGDLGL